MVSVLRFGCRGYFSVDEFTGRLSSLCFRTREPYTGSRTLTGPEKGSLPDTPLPVGRKSDRERSGIRSLPCVSRMTTSCLMREMPERGACAIVAITHFHVRLGAPNWPFRFRPRPANGRCSGATRWTSAFGTGLAAPGPDQADAFPPFAGVAPTTPAHWLPRTTSEYKFR